MNATPETKAQKSRQLPPGLQAGPVSQPKGLAVPLSCGKESMITEKERAVAAISAVMAVAEAIQALKAVPSGHIYARLMPRMELATYEAVIRTLKNAGLVKEDPSHLLVWTGPAKEAA